MTKEEFNLSEHEQVSGYFPADKVKEFIKKLKESPYMNIAQQNEIDNLAGDKLI